MGVEFDYIMQLIKPFSEGRMPSNIVYTIDSLLTVFSDSEGMEDLIFTTGKDSTTRLGVLKQYLCEGYRYIGENRKDIIEAYVKECFTGFLSPYSIKHPDESSLHVLEELFEEVESGELRMIDMLDNHPDLCAKCGYVRTTPEAPDYEESEEDDYDDGDYEDDNVEEPSDEEWAKMYNDADYDFDYDPAVEGDIPIGVPVTNPVPGMIAYLKYKSDQAINSIMTYLSRYNGPRPYDEILKYSYAIAEVINGKVFEEEVNGEIIAKLFSGIEIPSLSIKDRKESLWIQILLWMEGYGPKWCNREWTKQMCSIWNIHDNLDKQRNSGPSKKIEDILDSIQEKLDDIERQSS